MSKQALGFNVIVVNKKDFHASKKAIPLNSVNINNMVISYRIKHNDDSYKYFIGYLHDDGVKPFCIICVIYPQMSGYIKYFQNDGKTCHLKLKKRVFI